MSALEPAPASVELDHPISVAERVKLAFLLGYPAGLTRDAYTRDLHQWFDYCDTHALDPLTVRRVHLDAWVRSLEDAGRAKTTIARKLSVLSCFYQYAEDEELILRHPFGGLKRPKVSDQSQTLGLDRDQAARFLDTAEALGPDAHALACLLMIDGLRVSEACRLDVDSLTRHRGHQVIAFIGKGDQRHTAPLPPRVARAWTGATDGRTTGPLLRRPDGDRLDRFTAAYFIHRIADTLGLRGISPHSLRHTAATMALDAGVPLRDVQEFMRHKDPKTTIRYDRARRNLDGHASYTVAQWLAGGT